VQERDGECFGRTGSFIRILPSSNEYSVRGQLTCHSEPRLRGGIEEPRCITMSSFRGIVRLLPPLRDPLKMTRTIPEQKAAVEIIRGGILTQIARSFAMPYLAIEVLADLSWM